MIQLDASAQARFSYLATPPTHAALASRLIMYQEGAFAVVGMTLNYWFGTLDANGAFVANPNAGTKAVDLPPKPNTEPYVDPAAVIAVLNNVFSAGIIVDHTDVTKSVPMATKKMGDHNVIDIDAVAAHFDPMLSGTPV